MPRAKKEWSAREIRLLLTLKPKEVFEKLKGKRSISSINSKKNQLKAEGVTSVEERGTKARKLKSPESRLKKAENPALNFVINGVNVGLERTAKNVFIGTKSIKIDF